MNKNELIQRHSKDKLNVYRRYLETYLSVMTYAKFNPIFIVEPFAGCGKDINGNLGSAITAQKVARSATFKPNIYLLFNDINKTYCENLQKYLDTKDPYLEITNEDANKTINDALNRATLHSHQLFFIDPFGYTQIHGSTYNRLFCAERTDILIFIPVYHIYRFLRKEIDDEQLKPIGEFLTIFGINENSVKGVHNWQEFAEHIRGGIKKVANTEYVYKKEIRHETQNSGYCLFFLTKHIYGAEKFLEVLDGIEKKTPNLFQNMVDDQDDELIKAILSRSKWSNDGIYQMGIKLGFSKHSINLVLKQLEQDKRIVIREIQQRNRGSFYIGYDYFKKNSPRLEILTQQIHK